MKRKVVCIAIVGFLAVSGAALADDACKKIRGFWTAHAAECDVGTTGFDLCISGDLHGTIQGTWTSYLKEKTTPWVPDPDDWLVDLFEVGLPEPVPFTSNYGREYEVFSSEKGSLVGDAQYIFDIRIFDVNALLPLLTIVTDGTGMYEGATGWILATVEPSLEEASLRGEVCGPHIARGSETERRRIHRRGADRPSSLRSVK